MSSQSAAIYSFPIDRRMSLVRKTAMALFELNGEDANAYWRQMARELFNELLAQGRDAASARRDVLRFFDAVQDEFRRQLPNRQTTVSA